MRQNNEEVQYIWHDGVRIREDQLVSMAMNAGDYSIAEHYMCSLLAHGVIHGLAYIIDKVNEIREHYHVCTIPVPHKDATPGSSYGASIEEQVRKKYRRMTTEERIELIKASLGRMMANYPQSESGRPSRAGVLRAYRGPQCGTGNPAWARPPFPACCRPRPSCSHRARSPSC